MTDREKWLQQRRNGLGGSDAASAIGRSPWKTNVQLWLEKTGRSNPDDISDKPTVQYGTKAEGPLRTLFALDFPEYCIDYDQFGMLRNVVDAPWAFATLDGHLVDQHGRDGILEIKTVEIRTGAQAQHWRDKIPQYYYIQILHQFLATGYSFAILKAQQKWFHGDELRNIRTEHYFFDRGACEADIRMVYEMERRFWNCVQQDIRPDLILPEI